MFLNSVAVSEILPQNGEMNNPKRGATFEVTTSMLKWLFPCPTTNLL